MLLQISLTVKAAIIEILLSQDQLSIQTNHLHISVQSNIQACNHSAKKLQNT